jgi:protein phosphatase 2C
VASEEKRVRPSSASEEEGQEGETDDAALLEEEEGGTPQQQQQQQPLSSADPTPGAAAATRAWPVAFGWLSVAGRSREMEDAVSLRPGFYTWVDGSPMHFFGVFDGHGGSHVRTSRGLASPRRRRRMNFFSLVRSFILLF